MAIALLADAAEPVFAAARVLLRDEPDPGRKIPPRAKCVGITNARDQGSRQCKADTRDSVGGRRASAPLLPGRLAVAGGSVSGNSQPVRFARAGSDNRKRGTDGVL